jgi:hypothetical protein
MKRFFTIIFCLICIGLIEISCTKKPDKTEAWIEGELKGSSFSNLVVEELTPDGIQKIDSTAIINNKFKIKIKLNQTGFYFLRLSNKNFISLILEPGSETKILAPADSLGYPIEFSASNDNKLFLDLNHHLDHCYHVTDSLSTIFKSYQNTAEFDSIKPILDSAYLNMFNLHKLWLETYIDSHPKSLTTIVAFYQTLGRRAFFNPTIDYKTMLKIDQNLMQVDPKNKHILKFHELFTAQKVFANQKARVDSMLTKGNTMPAIVLQNTSEKSVNANNIVAAKKLFVFWNIKSMIDNTDLQTLNTINGTMKIVAVSLEDQKELWLNYIKKEFKNGIHVIDIHGLEGETAHTFNITTETIPYYILVNAKNEILSHGKELKTVINKN